MTFRPDQPDQTPLRFGDRQPIVASALVYIAVFAVFGILAPYFPIWLTARGLSKTEISIVMGTPMVLRLAVTPLIGRLADRQPDRRWLMAGIIACCLASAVALSFMSGFAAVMPLTCPMLVAYQPVQPLVDATVGVLVRRGRVRDFGRLRLCGSISFAVVAMLSGLLLEACGIDAVFHAFIGLIALAAASSFLLPSVGPLERHAQMQPFRLQEHPGLLVVFLAIALISASQAMYLNFGTMHMLAIGYPDWSIGLLWTVSVATEIVVFWYAPQALSRIGGYRLLLIAAFSTSLRWGGMAFDPPLLVAALLQTLHAGTLSCTYLALMSFIQRLVKDEAAARAQSATVTMTGLFMAAMTLLTGPLYQAFGGLAYGVAAILPGLAAILLFTFRKKLAA